MSARARAKSGSGAKAGRERASATSALPPSLAAAAAAAAAPKPPRFPPSPKPLLASALLLLPAPPPPRLSRGFCIMALPPLAPVADPVSVHNGQAPKPTPATHFKVVFVLGGPGSGKGTQCAKIVENFGYVHLSAGDLLRAEINSGNENGTMIQNMIKEGKIVPAEVTVKLLQKAMEESENDKFLIDGFPRNLDNRECFESVTGIEPQFILFFDCPEEEMERRLLGRNQGRVDDNIETIRKRFKVFIESSLPVVQFYEEAGKVHKIDATRTPNEVFSSIEPLFQQAKPTDSEVQEELVEAIKRHNLRGVPASE